MLNLLLDNIDWMTFNILLALIPVLLGWMFYVVKPKILKALLFIFWLLFVPNTFYIFIDITHLSRDLRLVDGLGSILIIIQYTLLMIAGLLTFILSLYPVDKIIKSPRFIIFINFLIGFGMVLGRVHRLNSWDVLFSIGNVARAAVEVFLSSKMLLLAILFGIFANIIYFLSKKKPI